MSDLKEVGQIVFDAVPMLPDCTGGCSLREGENELLTILLQIKDYLNKELHLSIEPHPIFLLINGCFCGASLRKCV
jgi:hypothetical protein